MIVAVSDVATLRRDTKVYRPVYLIFIRNAKFAIGRYACLWFYFACAKLTEYPRLVRHGALQDAVLSPSGRRQPPFTARMSAAKSVAAAQNCFRDAGDSISRVNGIALDPHRRRRLAAPGMQCGTHHVQDRLWHAWRLGPRSKTDNLVPILVGLLEKE